MTRHPISVLALLAVMLLCLHGAALAAHGEEGGTIEPMVDPMMGEANATAAQGTYDLERAVRRALEANPQMVSAEAQVENARLGARAVAGSYGPSLSTAYSYTAYDEPRPTSGRGAHEFQLYFNIHQNIFTGFERSSSYDKAKLGIEYTSANLTNTELSLILTVQENFLQLLQARANVEIARDSVTRLESQLKVTQAFYDVGLQPRLDVLQAEADLAEAQDALLQAQNAVATQVARLNTLLTLPLEADVLYVGELDYAPSHLDMQTALDRAYSQRPDIEMADLFVAMTREDVDIAKADLYPKVGADLEWYSVGDDPTVDGSKYLPSDYSATTFSVGVEWELFSWGTTYYDYKAEEQNVRRYAADLQNLRQEVAYEVKARHLQVEEAAERIKVARKGLAQAKEGYRMAVARYQAQVGTNTEVLDAQFRLTTAEGNLTQALADYRIALARLYVAIGEKNVSLTAY